MKRIPRLPKSTKPTKSISLMEAKAKRGGLDTEKASMLKKELSPKPVLKKTLVKKTRFVPSKKK